MTWLAFRQAVQTLVSTQSGLSPEAVVWGTHTDVCADPVIRLAVVSATEDQPTRHSGAETYLIEAVYRTVVQVRVETVSDLQVDDALACVQTLRFGLESILTRPVSPLVLVSMGPVLPQHFPVGGHLVQAWSFDLHLRHLLSLTVGSLGVIESVGVGGATTNPAITVPEVFYS
jgi:hypothetical protein